jgi:hypothetical protein
VVKGKINSSAKITLSDGVEVEEKLDASGAIELKNGVRVSQSHCSLLGLNIDRFARSVARLMLVERWSVMAVRWVSGLGVRSTAAGHAPSSGTSSQLAALMQAGKSRLRTQLPASPIL